MCSPVSYSLYCWETMPDSFAIIKDGKVVTCRNPYQACDALSFAPIVVAESVMPQPAPAKRPKMVPQVFEPKECCCPLSMEFNLDALSDVEDPSQTDFHWPESSQAA